MVLLLPVGKEGADLPLGARKAPGEEVPGVSGGVQKPFDGLLLGLGEKGGVGRSAPGGLVELIQHPGKELTLLRRPGDPV